jgi:2-pyrone-4,6-dicarboxylate lactonase
MTMHSALSSPQARSTDTLALPWGTCDSHVHVYEPEHTMPSVLAAKARHLAGQDHRQLFALHRQHGIARCVVVQSAAYGFDNHWVAQALQAGGGQYVGVALAPTDASNAQLERLAAARFRALRFNFMRHLPGADLADAIALTPRLADAGLHLQLHCESDRLAQLAGPLARSAVPVVIDHMGRVDARLGPGHPHFQALRALLRQPNVFVKLSGIDRIDPTPPYTAGIALARALLAEFPGQCLWGTDWPHPNMRTHMPDDGKLVDMIPKIAVTAEQQRKLLVDNPMRLYWG